MAPEQQEERFQLTISTIVIRELLSGRIGFPRGGDHPTTGYNEAEPENLSRRL